MQGVQSVRTPDNRLRGPIQNYEGLVRNLVRVGDQASPPMIGGPK